MEQMIANLIAFVQTKTKASILGALLAIIGLLSYIVWHQHEQEAATARIRKIERAARNAQLRNATSEFTGLIERNFQQPSEKKKP
jgi:predicted negative regulator of RcsB-dependent stress response